MKKIFALFTVCLLLSACIPPLSKIVVGYEDSSNASQAISIVIQDTSTPTTEPAVTPTPTIEPSSASSPTPAAEQANPTGSVPNFDHIVLIILENRDYEEVVNNPQMPNLNELAKQNALLTRYHAIRHPSLPNYIAIFSGSTQGITKDCTDCFVDQPNLADRIEASGRTWKTYEESMPSPCFVGDAKPYMQKHNPLIYFDSIRLNTARCQRSIVPLTQLDTDLQNNQLPNFAFIMPNMCNSGHDCEASVADQWVGQMVSKLQASPALGQNSLIIVTFDEANSQSKESCCGLGVKAGGRIAAVLISPLVQPGFTDGEESSHYSLLKTILTAWNLPDLGETAKDTVQPILEPWKK